MSAAWSTAVTLPAAAPTKLPMPPILRVEGLTKTFPVRRSWREMMRPPWGRAPRTTVVKQVSFEVAPAEFFGLLGANGAGKTTLFKMLATSLLPDGGSATVAGLDVVRQAREVRRVLTPGSAFIVVLLAGSWGALIWALRYARRNGTLSQY